MCGITHLEISCHFFLINGLKQQWEPCLPHSLKGLFTQKGFLTLMSFQTSKSLVHLLNTNEDRFDAIWDLSVLSIDSYATFSKSLWRDRKTNPYEL